MKKQKHLKERSKRKINKKMLIIRLVQLTFLILIIISLIEIYNWYKENKANEQILKDISNAIVVVENDEENQKEEDKYKIDFGELKKKNEDVVAWIKVNNTKIEQGGFFQIIEIILMEKIKTLLFMGTIAEMVVCLVV